MASSRFVKALLAPAAIAAAIGAPLLGASPASAATCAPDPYNGVCVVPVNATITTAVSRVAVQKTPKTGNTIRYVYGGGTIGIVCQITNGGTADGKTSTTWDAISGGGWVYHPYVKVATTTLRTCGTAAAVTTYNVSSYPWPAQDGFVSDGHGYYQGECVSFAAWAVRTDGRAHTKSPDFLGNASAWTGAYVDAVPHAGDVAQWDANYHGAGSSGHVAYVTAVNSDGSVTVNEYNWGTFHRLNVRTFLPGSAYSASRYLHF
jgi:surface antigen